MLEATDTLVELGKMTPKVLNIGFTTFLKLICLNTNGRMKELSRYQSGSGYDFYWSMKKGIPNIAYNDLSVKDVSQQIKDSLSRKAEIDHNISGVKTFSKWLKKNPIKLIPPPKKTIQIPNCDLSVKLHPEIAYEKDGKFYSLYMWNTANPDLTTIMAGIGVQFLNSRLKRGKYSNYEFGIFDLRKNKLRFSESITNESEVLLSADLASLAVIYNQF